MTHRLRSWSFAIANRLIGRYDGMVVSATAWQTALDRLAGLAEWSHSAGLTKRLAASHESVVEDITRMLAIAVEVGNPRLSLEEVRNRYVNLRLRAMSKKRRERLQYVHALEQLESQSRVLQAVPPSALPKETVDAQ